MKYLKTFNEFLLSDIKKDIDDVSPDSNIELDHPNTVYYNSNKDRIPKAKENLPFKDSRPYDLSDFEEDEDDE